MALAGLAAAPRPAASHHRRPGSAATAAAAAPEAARLQLRDALAGLASPDLQQQSVLAAQALLAASGGALTEPLLRDALRPADLATLPGSVRRARYRLAAHALRQHPPGADWGGVLLLARDRLVDRCGLEDHAGAGERSSVAARSLPALVELALAWPSKPFRCQLDPSLLLAQPRSWQGWGARWRRPASTHTRAAAWAPWAMPAPRATCPATGSASCCWRRCCGRPAGAAGFEVFAAADGASVMCQMQFAADAPRT